MKKLLLYTVFFFAAVCGYAQTNLVPNPYLEDTTFCPWAENQLPNYWTSFGNTPDYLNGCSSTLNVPNTPTGFHQAHSGVGMIGVYNYVDPNSSGWPDYREYIGTQLMSPLVIGQRYYMSFFMSFGQVLAASLGSNKIGSDKLGIKFSTVPYSDTSPPALNNFAHLYTDSIYTDTTQWIKISGSFIADSAYNYVMLGNFFNEANTDTLYFGGSNYYTFSSYYFIDDICVTTDSIYNGTWTGIAQATSKSVDFNLYPNPSNDIIHISLRGKNIDSVSFINCLGQLIYSVRVDSQEKVELNVSKLPSGIYSLRIKSHNEYSSKSIIINH
jgi:hypothetical protein